MGSFYYPPFLRAFNLSYMPTYCRRTRGMFLVHEPYWYFYIKHVLLRRSIYISVPNRDIKRVCFVHERHTAPMYPLTAARWRFLRHFNLINKYPYSDPEHRLGSTICIESCWLSKRFQPLYRKRYGCFYGGYMNWRYFRTRRKKPLRAVYIKSGYIYEHNTINSVGPTFTY